MILGRESDRPRAREQRAQSRARGGDDTRDSRERETKSPREPARSWQCVFSFLVFQLISGRTTTRHAT